MVVKLKAQKPLIDWMLQAANCGRTKRVEVLLMINFDQQPAPGQPWLLDHAIENGHFELVRLLLRSKKTTKFAGRCNKCHVDKHLMFASRRQDENYAKAALEADSRHESPDAWILPMQARRTPLMAFAASGNLEMCKICVERGAQVDRTDKFNCTAVHYAKALHHDHIVEYLESIKEATELPVPEEHTINWLCNAIYVGCAGAVSRFVRSNLERLQDAPGGPLVAMEALINTKVGSDIGETTPLHLAVRYAYKKNEGLYMSDFQVARALLLAKADPFARSAKDDTPLHTAAHTPDLEHYNALLDVYYQLFEGKVCMKLEQDMFNSEGSSPGEMAVRNRMREKMLGRHDEEEEITLVRGGFLAFAINRFEQRLERVREAQLPTWWEVLRSQKGSLTREDLFKWNEIISEEEAPALSRSGSRTNTNRSLHATSTTEVHSYTPRQGEKLEKVDASRSMAPMRYTRPSQPEMRKTHSDHHLAKTH
jgi:hypothetical protein